LQQEPDHWIAALDVVSDPVVMHDAQGRILHANSAYAARAGAGVDALVGRFYWEAFPKLPGPPPSNSDDGAAKGDDCGRELRLASATAWTAWTYPATDAAASGDVTLCVLRETEPAEHRLNRSLRILSACNSALVHAEDEAALLNEVCRLIVSLGQYRMAWVGFACQDQSAGLTAVARAAADDACVARLPATWSEAECDSEPTGLAIRRRKSVLVRDVRSVPAGAPWCEEAVRHGFASIVALPVRAGDKILGALTIYAAAADAFDAEEVGLLEGLANDLGYGIASLREAAERERLEQELDYQHNFDVLTGLPNRKLFAERVGRDLIHAGRSGRTVAVLSLDIDRFQSVNDSLGHGSGDALLMLIGKSLSACLRQGDTVARLGGDQFALCVSEVANADEAGTIVRRVQAAVAQPLDVAGRPVSVSASMGISLFPKDGSEVEVLLSRAEHALYDAKSLGGNAFRFYAAETNERMSNRFALEVDLRRAIERDELLVHYQPKVSLSSGAVTGAEVLVRWQHPEHGLLPPADFIPLAEATGLIQALGEWVMHTVCGQMRSWQDAGMAIPPLAVNLSAHQFRDENLAHSVDQALQSHHVGADNVELEITESVLMGDLTRAVATLGRLRSLGLKLSLDDFGTGYSSLSYLKRFPITSLKIDRSFVQDITTDPDDAAICVAVIDLAHNLKLRVVAEGVETDGQMNYLRRHRCDEMQGYYFSRPIPPGDFVSFIDDARCLNLPAREGRQQTLLLVDDEPNVLSALKRAFRADGYRVLTAAGAREGLEMLAIHEVQVVLTDQRMTEMSGTEFLERVRNLHPDTIRIVLSGYTDLKTLTDAINRGAIYKFLTKPWESDMLREHVREAFRHHEVGRRTWN
jgi:diguanylate cyclase (GGDEF)-like protein